MLFILVLAAIACLWWWLYTPPTRFVQGFASLLDNPERQNWFPGVILGKLDVDGSFKDRAVNLQIALPRRHRPGYLVVSMKTDAREGASWKDSRLTTSDADISRATFDLEGRFELILSLDSGWLRATWSPMRLRFPGPFDVHRWRTTLEHMHTLVDWMEARERR